jgi:hypothetical protein
MVSSKKKKAEKRRARALASEIFSRSLPSPAQPLSSSSPTMSSHRRDPSPRRGYPRSPPRGPRAEGEGYQFTPSTWKPRDSSSDVRQHRARSRSRSRSPARRSSTRPDSYNPSYQQSSEYRDEVERRSKENYRPIYDDTPTRQFAKDTRRKYSTYPIFALHFLYIIS